MDQGIFGYQLLRLNLNISNCDIVEDWTLGLAKSYKL